MKYCSNCGNQCPENTIYCPNCCANVDVASNVVQNVVENPMGNAYYGGMTPQNQNKTNIWCILGLVFAFIFPIFGLIFSILGLIQVKTTGEKGKGLAKAGLILSIILPIVLVVLVIFLFSGVIWPNISNNLELQTACANVDSNGNYTSSDGVVVCEDYVCEYEKDGVRLSSSCDMFDE